jgi:DNA-binding NarL/FixJ family response regulator
MSIFVIDEHPMMREALAALIRRLNHTANVIEIGSLATALSVVQASGTQPELICLDLALDGHSGLLTVAELKRHFADVPIVVIAAVPEQKFKDLALKAGAAAFIHKSASASAISNVLRVFLTANEEGEGTAPPEKLSKRQKQLLKLLDKGMSNRDIAETLEISEHTVKVHLWRLFRRINVKSRSQATHLARTHGLL